MSRAIVCGLRVWLASWQMNACTPKIYGVGGKFREDDVYLRARARLWCTTRRSRWCKMMRRDVRWLNFFIFIGEWRLCEWFSNVNSELYNFRLTNAKASIFQDVARVTQNNNSLCDHFESSTSGFTLEFMFIYFSFEPNNRGHVILIVSHDVTVDDFKTPRDDRRKWPQPEHMFARKHVLDIHEAPRTS